jgi:hypothetical protein
MYINTHQMTNYITNKYITNKYIIEDNLDFKTAMENTSDIKKDSVDNEETCLITKQLLTKSHIKLPCGHTFNYMPLYNELYKQKQKNPFEICNLNVNQLKCPYCRKVFDTILPYIQSECIIKTHGVNYPFKFCMKNTVECEWIKKTKVKCCNEAQFINDKSYCKMHFMKMQDNEIKAELAKEQITWTTDMNHMCKSKTLAELKTTLKQHKLKVSGTKRKLIERIFEHKLNNVIN